MLVEVAFEDDSLKYSEKLLAEQILQPYRLEFPK